MFTLLLQMVKDRLQIFRTSLISEGKTSALMHGLLAFFKHVFADFSVGNKESLGEEKFLKWRVFYKDMLHTSLEISKVCANLLSNNRITDDGEEAVDCRGHPIAQPKDMSQIVAAATSDGDAGDQGTSAFDDYANLILVGVWLAV